MCCIGREVEGVQCGVSDVDPKHHILPSAVGEIVIAVPPNDMSLTVAGNRIRQPLEVGATRGGFDSHAKMAARFYVRVERKLIAAELDRLGDDDVFDVVRIFKRGETVDTPFGDAELVGQVARMARLSSFVLQ